MSKSRPGARSISPRRGRSLEELGRPNPTRQPRQLFLISCEDEKSAAQYFKDLCADRGQDRVRIVIASHQGSDPASVVQAAVDADEEQRKRARSGTDVPYDEVWCVFDVEGPQHPTRKKQVLAAMERTRDLKYQTAISNPSFEYWVLLHFEINTDTFQDGNAVLRRLRGVGLRDYSKGTSSYPEIGGRTFDAIKRATKLFRERCETYHNNPVECHPCTLVYRLVEKLIGPEPADDEDQARATEQSPAPRRPRPRKR